DCTLAERSYIGRMIISQPCSHATILNISILIFFSSCHIASNSCSYHLFIWSSQKWKVMTDIDIFRIIRNDAGGGI
ncbi:MAG: hypothetical protein WCF01_03595, partial [Nitrososphaeraceae archaeon]